jgi:peptidyl-prolyl cis-trans isomerase C
MRRFHSIKPIALAALAFFAFKLDAIAKTVDTVLVTVNGEAIYLSEFEKNWGGYLDQQKKLLPPGQMTPQWEQDNKKLLLNEMVEQRLLLQEAKKKEVKVPKKDLEEGIRQVKERFKFDEQGRPLSPSEADEAFKKELAKEGLTQKQFEDRIEDQLRVIMLTNEVIRSKVKPPTDDAINALFQKVQARMAEAKPTPTNDPQQADIDAMAQYFRMKTDESVRVRHILIKADSNAVLQERTAALKKAEDIRKKLVNGADFEDMAKKYSEDPSSAQKGGDLGFIVRGQMVKSFEQAAFLLPVGSISNVVQSEFGYHIIKVQEKRAHSKLRLEDVKDDLKEYLFRSVAREQYNQFVAGLRKKAVVDVRADFAKPS